MLKLASSLIDELRCRHQTICFCESVTAGLAAATLAEVPGASAVLRGGLIPYATDLKHSLARVPEDVVAKHGPVSALTAREMARGARKVCGADWAVAITGVAGPSEQDGHPVGQVWVGLAGPTWTASSSAAELIGHEYSRYALVSGASEPVRILAGDRATIRTSAVRAALVGALTGVREQKAVLDR